ncbi:MAG: carboxypeptidase regulatory-like domain-containing protein [Bacteroidota bacterium]
MRKSIQSLVIIAFCIFGVNTNTFAQGKGIGYKYQLLKAKSKFSDEDFNGAIRMLRQMATKYQNDAKINFLLGECLYETKSFDKAIEHFEISKQANPNYNRRLFIELGECFQAMGNLDKALKEYETYNSKLITEKDKKDSSAYKLIEQINFAKTMMSKPLNVNIKNLGLNVNSIYTDAAPCISADGKTLIFTSRRPDTKGGGLDPNTGNYFDDIYMSKWDDTKQNWTEATPVEELNTEGFDASLSLSTDGNILYTYRNVPKETQSGDIYFSKKKDDKWSAPKPMPSPINSSFFESSACLSPDGNTLYFISERKKGLGNGDIWKSTKISSTEWGPAVNLGPMINTPEDEIGIFIHPDGKTLYFSSKGHNSMGGYDIFKSKFENGQWSTPTNLGYPINTIKDEIHFVIRADNKKAFVSAKKDDGLGEYDIYEIDLSNCSEFNSNVANANLSIIQGIITDNTEKTIESAKITFTNDISKEVYIINSDENGNYFLTLPANINYSVKVEKEGYKAKELKIKLDFDSQQIKSNTQNIIIEK